MRPHLLGNEVLANSGHSSPASVALILGIGVIVVGISAYLRLRKRK